LEVTYELSESDISQLFRYIKNYRSHMRPVFVYAFIGVLGALLLAYTYFFLLHPSRSQGGPDWPSLLSLFIVLALLIYLTIVHPLLAQRRRQRDPQVVGRRTVRVSAIGINVKHSLGEAALHWPLFVDVVDDRDCYYFFMEKNNALVVPKRAFSSRSEANSFYETAKQSWHVAKNLTPPHQADQPATWPPAPRPTDAQEPGAGP